jgi:hypothetical protein
MGTSITLELAGMVLTHSKNDIGPDHGALFQEIDRKRIRSDQIDYEYFEKIKEEPISMEMAFSRKLKDVLPRLELLGFTKEQAKPLYESVLEQYLEDISYINQDNGDNNTNLDVMSFEDFCTFAVTHPIENLSDAYVYDKENRDELIKGHFTKSNKSKQIPSLYNDNAYSERSYFGELVNIIDPYVLLHILAENPQNRESDIVWQYGPLIDNGWADPSEFIPCARRTQTFMIATEGSSDVHILRHALRILRPDIVDFFRFIDVSDSHPFSGTGSLAKFAEGLAKIDVQNQTIFIFDNDAEGYEACQRVINRFVLPPNMRAITLPELAEFNSFPAKGPNGIINADINKKAAAIECYLDLNFITKQPPHIVWTNYKKDIDAYQGSLENKEDHYRAFLKVTKNDIENGHYNAKKLHIVLDRLIAECSSIAQYLNSNKGV